MAHEVLKGAPVSAKAQTEANETGSPCPGKYGPPTTKGDFMEFDAEREAVCTVDTSPTAAPAAGAVSASSEALKTAVRKVLLNNRMTQDRMAREAGLSGSALSQWLHGKYQGDVPALEGRLVAWLADTQASALEPCEVAPVWVQTPTATAIEGALNYARARPSIAVVYGGAGVGKTTTIERYARESAGVWVWEASKSQRSMLEALRAIEEIMSGYRCEEKRSSTISRMIAQRLLWAPKPALLVVDEAQHLELDAVEELRSIHDSTGVGLVLSGNESVYTQLTGRTRRADFAQLFSRVGKRLRLDKPAPGDVAAILQAWRIEGTKERELCQQIASLPGGLRGLVNVLVDAATAAQAMGRTVDLIALRAAWSDQGAMQ